MRKGFLLYYQEELISLLVEDVTYFQRKQITGAEIEFLTYGHSYHADIFSSPPLHGAAPHNISPVVAASAFPYIMPAATETDNRRRNRIFEQYYIIYGDDYIVCYL